MCHFVFISCLYLAILAASTSALASTVAKNNLGTIVDSKTVTTQKQEQMPQGECDISSNATQSSCSTMSVDGNLVAPNGAVISSSNSDNPIVGARILSGSTDIENTTAIDAFGYCRYILNASANALFIPFLTSYEWKAFFDSVAAAQIGKNSAIKDISAFNCSRGGDVFIPSNFGDAVQTNQCAMSDLNEKPVLAPYKSYPESKTFNSPEVTFSCTTIDGTAFTETATATFTGINSGKGEPENEGVPGWEIQNVLYKYDGVCGTAADTKTKDAPTNNLCHVGVPTAVTKSEDGQSWTWTCSSGNGGGTPATCNAPSPKGCVIQSTSFDIGSLVSYLVAPNGTPLPGTYTLQLALGAEPNTDCYCQAPNMSSPGALAQIDYKGSTYCNVDAACKLATITINGNVYPNMPGMFNATDLWCYYPMAFYRESCSPMVGSSAVQCTVDIRSLSPSNFKTVPSGLMSHTSEQRTIFNKWLSLTYEDFSPSEISIDTKARASYFSATHTSYNSTPVQPSWGNYNTGGSGSGGGINYGN